MLSNRVLVLLMGVLLSNTTMASAEEYKVFRPSGMTSSADAIVTGNSTPAEMALAGQYMVNNGYYDRAIQLCQKALSKDIDDCDIHKVYAEALEGKLHSEKRDNPDLYKAALREWLIVLRNQQGDERGMTFKGIGLPGVGKLYEDEDHSKDARNHIRNITGMEPHAWEPDELFIKRASRASTSVSAKLLHSDFSLPGDKQPAAESAPTGASTYPGEFKSPGTRTVSPGIDSEPIQYPATPSKPPNPADPLDWMNR